MGFTTDLSFTLNLAGTGTKSSHVVAGAIERAGANSERLSALFASALNTRQLLGGIVFSQMLAIHCVSAFDRAKSLVGRGRSMKDCATNLARNIIIDFVGGGYSKLSKASTFPVAIVVLVCFGAALCYFLGFAASSAVHDHTLTGCVIAACAAAILLISIAGKNSKFLAALLAVATFGEFFAGHKRNLLSDGWHVCLGHAGPTGGIHNYIRLWANHQAQACPKPLHYNTGVLSGVVP